MAKPKVGGYNWRDYYRKTDMLHTQMYREIRELGCELKTSHRRLLELGMMLAESHAAIRKMASIAENGEEKGR